MMKPSWKMTKEEKLKSIKGVILVLIVYGVYALWRYPMPIGIINAVLLLCIIIIALDAYSPKPLFPQIALETKHKAALYSLPICIAIILFAVWKWEDPYGIIIAVLAVILWIIGITGYSNQHT